jgi:hypothetical protein
LPQRRACRGGQWSAGDATTARAEQVDSGPNKTMIAGRGSYKWWDACGEWKTSVVWSQ